MTDSSKKRNNAAVIPCYNERNTIRRVVESVRDYVDQVIVVDDGSTDDSALQIIEMERVAILQNGINRGKGVALNLGIKHADSLGVDSIITIDADLQHPPELIPVFLQFLQQSDIVIGVRKKKGTSMPPHRRLSNFLTTYILKKKTGLQLHDSQCGYRAYRISAIRDILPESNGFEAETEILIKAAFKGLSFGFVDIPTIYGDTDSKMNSFKAITGFLRVILKKY